METVPTRAFIDKLQICITGNSGKTLIFRLLPKGQGSQFALSGQTGQQLDDAVNEKLDGDCRE